MLFVKQYKINIQNQNLKKM